MPVVVLITGCSSGLGRALALCLHAEGAGGDGGARPYRVFASARNQGSLKGLEAAGLETVQLDVTDQKSVDRAVQRVIQKAGRIDVLVNNAGLSRVGPVVEQPLSEIQEIMNANFFGAVRVTQAVAPHMMRARGGLVVMVGSVVSMLASPFGGAYSASKAALLALSDSLRAELEPFGVRLTYVTAGAIKTAFADNILSGTQVARYERPDSLYRPLADKIRARASASQDPAVSMSADVVAGQVAKVIGRSVLPPPGSGGSSGAQVWRPRPPPTSCLVGGAALLFWILGVVQKLVGWPVNGMLARRFGLNKPL